jgi:hypothetical protein
MYEFKPVGLPLVGILSVSHGWQHSPLVNSCTYLYTVKGITAEGCCIL